jgi:S1-C subfamily serine protease
MSDKRLRIRSGWLLAGVAPAALLVALLQSRADEPGKKADGPGKKVEPVAVNPKVRLAEKKRVAAIKKVHPAVVAVISGGGSGVLIDDEGYALTNFHVTSSRPVGKAGLPDGIQYDYVLVGEDKVGDVALIKLLPNKEGGKIVAPKDGKFPFAKMGDSDKVRAGDWSLAMGNPFLLATDFTPTVTFGLISGVHRYQYPAGTLLEYTDCIQIDTSINPGNSGGPLFNMDGELIGINGRGSFEKRGRVNSGVGYAISINQIKNFMGQLRAGMDTDHASLGASVASESEEGGISRVLVMSIIDSDARRRGLDVGDQLVSFASRPVSTVNQYKNVLGLYPKGWRVPIVYRRENNKKESLVRLMGVQRQELGGPGPGPGPKPGPRPGPRPAPAGAAGKFYIGKPGFANYYFNKEAQNRLLENYKKIGDFSKKTGDWSIFCKATLSTGGGKGKEVNAAFNILAKGPKVMAEIDVGDYTLEPLASGNVDLKQPTDTGGLLLAMYQFRQMAGQGRKGFTKKDDFSHGGIEPYYLWMSDKEKPDYAKARVDAEVLRTRHGGVAARWYFAIEDDKAKRFKKGELIGFEVWPDKDEDPCEVVVSDYQDVGEGQKLPHRFDVRYRDNNYGTFRVNKDGYKLK